MESNTTYVLAPLAGYTDLPFRRMCWKQGMDQAYTALIDAGALIFGNPENSHIFFLLFSCLSASFFVYVHIIAYHLSQNHHRKHKAFSPRV